MSGKTIECEWNGKLFSGRVDTRYDICIIVAGPAIEEKDSPPNEEVEGNEKQTEQA
jgi:hypothetical protein